MILFHCFGGRCWTSTPTLAICADYTTVVMKRVLSVGDLSAINSVDFDHADGGPFTQVKTRSKNQGKLQMLVEAIKQLQDQN